MFFAQAKGKFPRREDGELFFHSGYESAYFGDEMPYIKF